MSEPKPFTKTLLLAVLAMATGCRAGDPTMTSSSSIPAPALAETPLPVEAVFGVWRLLAADGSDKGRCHLALSNLGTGAVRGVVAEACSIEAAASARGWRATAQGFELLDASERGLMRFERVDVDRFETLDGRYRLERAAMA